MHTFYKSLENYVLNSRLSDDYKRELIDCVHALSTGSLASIKDRRQYKSLMESARGNLRGARAHATFDDLWKLNYAHFEYSVLNFYGSWILRGASGRHERYIRAAGL